MHAMPFAAQPSDGNATTEPSATATPMVPLRVCLYGTNTPDAATLTALRGRLPRDARLVLAGACATSEAWPDAERLGGVDRGADPTEVAIAAAQRFPGEHLILVRADLALPEFACERLLRALAGARVLGAVALDSASRRPLPRERTSTIDAAQIDALCYAWSIGAFATIRISSRARRRGAPPGMARAWPNSVPNACANATPSKPPDGASCCSIISTSKPPRRSPKRSRPNAIRAIPNRLLRWRRCASASLPRSSPAPCRHDPASTASRCCCMCCTAGAAGAERWVRDYATGDDGAHHLVLIARGSFARRRHGEWAGAARRHAERAAAATLAAAAANRRHRARRCELSRSFRRHPARLLHRRRRRVVADWTQPRRTAQRPAAVLHRA